MSISPAPYTRIERRRVYKAINRPLTICGVERRLFFLALTVGAAAFNLFYSLLAGSLLATGLYAFGLWSMKHDTQMLRILSTSARFRTRYDAAKHEPARIEVRTC
jgi:type IV secretory pathway VirB3-like protein